MWMDLELDGSTHIWMVTYGRMDLGLDGWSSLRWMTYDRMDGLRSNECLNGWMDGWRDEHFGWMISDGQLDVSRRKLRSDGYADGWYWRI